MERPGTPDSSYYKATSQHIFGRAADCLFSHAGTEAVRRQILDAPDDPCFELIGSLELGTSWLHINVRTAGASKPIIPDQDAIRTDTPGRCCN